MASHDTSVQDQRSAHTRPHRRVRSFVRREGKITAAQRRALEELWPRYGLQPAAEPLDLAALFGRRAPVTLEIGFGNGDALAEMADAHPEQDFIGIEVHRPGVGRLLLSLEQRGLANVRVICADATDVVPSAFAPASLACILIFFPDPWPKKRHHKRRLIQPEFAMTLSEKLAPGGLLHVATDWPDYAEHIRQTLDTLPGLRNSAGAQGYAERPEYRPETRFERRGVERGHPVYDLIYRRRHDAAE